jgi:hypothetical protein
MSHQYAALPFADHVAWIELSSPDSFARLADDVARLIEREDPFGLVLTVDGIDLDRHRVAFPEVRKLRGGRARFGTWCRGVVYVFDTPASQAAARIHVDQAARIWGTKVCIAKSGTDATAWLERQFAWYR